MVSNGSRVVLVTHSFGSYIATAYVHYHPTKVAGIVEFGCIPVTFYTVIKVFGGRYMLGSGDHSLGTLIKNKDSIYQDYLAWISGAPSESPSPLRIYTFIAFCAILSAEVLQEMFAWRRSYPKILKLITFGRRDTIFEVYLLNEMAYHYAYGGGRLSSDYNEEMVQRYNALTNCEATNIQERFVYSVPKAGHGLHIKRKKLLQNLMNLYFGLVLGDYPESSSL